MGPKEGRGIPNWQSGVHRLKKRQKRPINPIHQELFAVGKYERQLFGGKSGNMMDLMPSYYRAASVVEVEHHSR